MVFADDIALGDFTSVDLDDLVAKDYYSGRGNEQRRPFSWLLVWALGRLGSFGQYLRRISSLV